MPVSQAILRATILSLVVTALACGGEEASITATRLPNIVLIISDDHGWSDFGFMGSKIARTPQIDTLAARGVRFSLAFNTGNICRPSLQSILTGYHPAQYAARVSALGRSADSRSDEPPIRQIETLPRLLAERGYVSFQGGKYWEGSYQDGGFTEGLAEKIDNPISIEDPATHRTNGPEPALGHFANSPLFRAAGGEGLELGRSTMDPVFEFIDDNQEKPFFVWFAPLLPHQPFDASPADRKPYDAAGLSKDAIGYYANIARLDRRVGELISYIEKRGLTNETLIVFLSDNGWEASQPEDFPEYNLGGARGKSSIHETAFRTPLILTWPSQIVPRTDDRHLISTVDLFATLLDFAGITPPADRWGESLEPLLSGTGSFARKSVMAEVNRLRKPPGGRYPFVEDLHGLFMRTQNWRYVRTIERETEALYSMSEDPDETTNVCALHQDICDRMRKNLGAWQSAMSISPPIPPRRN